MVRFFAVAVLLAGLGLVVLSASVTADGKLNTSSDVVSRIAAQWIAEAIPRQYERTKDWGRTKRITTGLRSSGNFFDFDIHRRKRDVKHGVWKAYRVQLLEPEEQLVVRIENLRHLGPSGIAFTVHVAAKLRAWARAKVYDRGIHLIAVEAEGDAAVQLSVDAEVTLESLRTESYLPGVAVRPVVTGARLTFDSFRLHRISDLRGALAREIGDGLRHMIEDELAGPKLAAKLNRSIEKRRERFQLTPELLLGRQ